MVYVKHAYPVSKRTRLDTCLGPILPTLAWLRYRELNPGLGLKELPKRPYTHVVQDLSYNKGMLVPSELQSRAVALAHEGHEGIEPNLRDIVWFPQMADMVKDYVGSCLGCVAYVPFNPPAPITTRAHQMVHGRYAVLTTRDPLEVCGDIIFMSS